MEKDGLEEEECHLLQKVTFYRGKVSVKNEQRLPDDNTDLGTKMGTQREVGVLVDLRNKIWALPHFMKKGVNPKKLGYFLHFT